MTTYNAPPHHHYESDHEIPEDLIREWRECSESAEKGDRHTGLGGHTSPITPEPHGVVVKDRGHWNTKTIYNTGTPLASFGIQPKAIRFISPMVNDFNQHLCGLWAFPEIPDLGNAICNELCAGRKPAGRVVFDNERWLLAHEQWDRLREAGLEVRLRKRRRRAGIEWVLTACQDISLGDIGSLDLLREDFEGAQCHLEVDPIFGGSAVDRPLCDELYFLGEKTPRWKHDLILGYPVENTISRYRQAFLVFGRRVAMARREGFFAGSSAESRFRS